MSALSNAPLVVAYNGVVFPTETETQEVQIKPVYDSSGRAVKYITYTITLRSTLGVDNQEIGDTTDFTLAALRKRLTAPAGEFHYEQVGMGALTINIPPGGPTVGANGPAKDVIWGPKPELLTWKPLGQVACDIVWRVSVSIPECDLASYQFKIMEFCFKVSISIDKSGYSTRVYSGFLRIPQTRSTVDSRTLSDQADNYRERIYPPLLPGFRRTPGKFTLSEDKCRLDFEVTDEELSTNIAPAGVTEVDASTTVTSGPGALPGGVDWRWTTTATYTMDRGVPRAKAMNAFHDLLADRLENARTGFSVDRYGRNRMKVSVIPIYWSQSEPEIYGKKGASFTATYRMLFHQNDMLAMSGLWRPAPGGDWSAWSQSTAYSARGNAGLRFDTTVDAIVDLCAGTTSQSSLSAGQPPVPPPPDYSLATIPFAGELPPRESSWVYYTSAVRLEDVDETYELKTLPTSPYQLSTPGSGYSLSTTGGNGGGGGDGTPAAETLVGPGPSDDDPFPAEGAKLDRISVQPDPAVVIQQRGNPSRYAYLEGVAARAGYPVDVPDLKQVGAAAAVRSNRADRGEGTQSMIIANWFGVPIYAATWRLRYLLSGPITAIDTPATPYS